MEISTAFQYLTRIDSPVIIYAIYDRGDYPVHGAYWDNTEWRIAAWTEEGKVYKDQNRSLDIVRQA